MNKLLHTLKNNPFKFIAGLGVAVLLLTLAYAVGAFALITTAAIVALQFLISIAMALWVWLIGFLSTLFAGTWLVALVSTVAGWLTALWTWFAATWLGGIFVPIYQIIFPIVSKIAPFFTVGKGSTRLLKWAKKIQSKLQKRGETELQLALEDKSKNEKET